MAGGLIGWVRGLLRQRTASPPVEPKRDWLALSKALPFERVETTSEKALSVWEGLREMGRGWPIVVGGDEDLCALAEHYTRGDARSPEAILAAAHVLEFPGGLQDWRDRCLEQARAWFAEHSPSALREIDDSAKTTFLEATWPDTPPAPTELSVAYDVYGKSRARVHILVIPASSGLEAPAFLRWGGWNENPPPEYHIAALRYWHERYGAELIGMSFDVLNLRVSRKPDSRFEAMDLAKEQLLYCEDIVTQGVGTIENLAAALHAHDWWYFWWD